MVAATALNVGAISPLPARGEAGIDGMLPEQTAALPEKQTAIETKPALERGEFFEFFEAAIDVFARQCGMDQKH